MNLYSKWVSDSFAESSESTFYIYREFFLFMAIKKNVDEYKGRKTMDSEEEENSKHMGK